MDAASIAAAAVATPPPGPAVTVQVPRGQVDLIDFIDWTGVECLNQDSSHNIVNALKQAMTQILKGINSYRSSLKVPLSENKNAPVIRSVPFTITPIIMYSESGSRLFGFIGAGATLGQLFGSLFAASMAWLGPFLLLFSSLLMELAALSSKGMCIDENHASAELCQIGAGQAPNTMADDEISASNGDNDEWSEV